MDAGYLGTARDLLPLQVTRRVPLACQVARSSFHDAAGATGLKRIVR
jgi:hypothetical protein